MNEVRKLMEVIERINEDEPCSICKGQGRPWDPYATYEGGAYRDCEACRGTGDESVRLGEPEDELDEGRVEDFMIAHEQAWIKKLEQQIAHYSESQDKGTEWNEGAQWVLQKIYQRHGNPNN